MAEEPTPGVAELPRIDEHGEVHQDDCPGCRNKQRQINMLDSDLVTSLKKNVRLEDLVEKYKQELKEVREDRRQSSKLRAEIEEAFNDWRTQTSHLNCVLTAKRHDKIQARLNEGYTVEHFKLANTGAAQNPWPARLGYTKPMTEIAIYASQGTFLEDYANRGAYWLRENGHPDVEVPFIEQEHPLDALEKEFLRAGLAIVVDKDLGRAQGVCPFCTKTVKVAVDESGERLYECVSGCKPAVVADALVWALRKKNRAFEFETAADAEAASVASTSTESAF